MTTTSLSTFDPDKIRVRSGEVYISLYPLANPGTDLTPPNVVKGFFGQFYQDGNKKNQLLPSMLRWATIDSKGFVLENKFKNVDFDPARGLKVNAGKYLESCNCGCNIGEVASTKFAELLSATANELISIAAASGQAGKLGVMMGSQPYNNRYTLMYRWPSPNFPGEFDHVLIPRCVFQVDSKLEFLKTKAQDLVVSVQAEDDLYLISPDSGMPASSYYEETVAAATA